MGVFGATPTLASPGEAATGPDLGAWESFTSVFNEAYSVDTALGFEADLQLRFSESIDKLNARLGRTTSFKPNHGDVYNAFVRPLVDPTGERLVASALYNDTGSTNELLRRAPDAAKKLNEEIKALGDPNIKSAEDLIKEIKGEYLQKSQAAADADFVPGLVGGVLGNLSAMATLRDAPSLLTLPFGGWGKSVLTRIATESAVMGATEFAIQQATIQPQRELLGLPTQSVTESVVASALLGGALRGGFEGASALFRFGSDKAGRETALDFNTATDDELRTVFEATPDSPSSRAGLHLLEQDQAFRGANPYGDTETGLLRFEEELTQLRLAMSGLPDTAIARTLPDTGLPLDLEDLSLDVQVVRERSPQIYQAVVDAQAKLQLLDDNIELASQNIEDIRVSDAFTETPSARQEDIDTGNLLASYEDELRQPGLTTKRREEIETAVNKIVESSGGAEFVARRVGEIETVRRHELRSLRASRKAAKKQVHAARKVLDQAVAQLKAEQRVKELMQGATPQRAGKAELLSGTYQARSQTVEERFAQVAERKLPPNTQLWDELMKDQDFFRGPTLVKNGDTIEIDLGNGKTVPKDTEIPHPTNPARSIKLADVIKDLEGDVAQIEAMKGCTL